MGVEPAELKRWLHDGSEIALLDVREHGQYGEAHLFYAVPLPYSRLELELPRLLPRLGARAVLYDDGASGVAERAARRMHAVGYSDVHVLRGGSAAWRQAGYELFAGVNVPSKSFGELVERTCHTPRISAAALAAKQARGERLVVLDGRPFAEYRKMNIPGSICCPNGELALRVGEIVRDPETTIVVNCAGRTRSIIGAQTLINFGLPNPVLALENGTQGWFLADLELEHGADRRYLGTPTPDRLAALRAQAARLAARHGVPIIDQATVASWLADESRTTYLCDVRTPEEFEVGSLPGAQGTPGGQLIQSTDQYIGVRGARLVLFDGEFVRAPVVATWLKQMGWKVHVLAEGAMARVAVPAPARAAQPSLPPIGAEALRGLLEGGGARLIDLRPSAAYRKSHIRGALWAIRPHLVDLAVDSERPVVLVAAEPALAALAALELTERGVTDIRVHVGAPDAWQAAGLALEATPALPADADCIDYLFFTHDRHDGNKEAARQYLAWETNLVAQLDARERTGFKLAPR